MYHTSWWLIINDYFAFNIYSYVRFEIMLSIPWGEETNLQITVNQL